MVRGPAPPVGGELPPPYLGYHNSQMLNPGGELNSLVRVISLEIRGGTMSQPTILYVEDDTLVAMTAVEIFKDGGYAVVHVSTGQAALAALDSAPEQFAALVTDIRLPGGIDGWMIAEQARELQPSTPVIYVSGDSAADWPSKGVPGSIMLQKPYAEAQLIGAVTTLLNQVASQLPPADHL